MHIRASLHFNEKKAVQPAAEGGGRHLGKRMAEDIVEGLKAGGDSKLITWFQ